MTEPEQTLEAAAALVGTVWATSHEPWSAMYYRVMTLEDELLDDDRRKAHPARARTVRCTPDGNPMRFDGKMVDRLIPLEELAGGEWLFVQQAPPLLRRGR